MIGSFAVVALMLSSFLTLNMVGMKREKANIAVFDVRLEKEMPPPPAQRVEPEPVQSPVDTPVPIVAPEPLIQTIASPVEMATSPTPAPPELVAPTGPPTQLRAAVPKIERVGNLASGMIAATPPRYPVEARRKREEGVVVLLILLGIDGTVAEISIARSSGHDRLDRAALSAVRQWRWRPTERGGVPVMVRGVVEIPFVLMR